MKEVMPARPSSENTEHSARLRPGTGKTRFLSEQAARASKKFGEHSVVICALTRAAASEIGSRAGLPRGQVGTLHSLCFHGLEMTRGSIAEGTDGLKAWNKWIGTRVPVWQIDTKHTIDPENAPPEAFSSWTSDGERLLSECGVLRARRTHPGFWPPEATRFYRLWCEWKTESRFVDFTELLERGLTELPVCPGEPTILMADEAQDMSALEMALLRQWSEHVEQLVIVGDPDQCQPAGTLVLTANHGSVPIEHLDPDLHGLVSLDRHSSTLTGRRDGYPFEITSRQYTGRLITVGVAAASRSTRCTHDHRWPVKWNPEGNRAACVTYLMRKDDDWRIGWCQLQGQNGFHFGRRCLLDQADEGWILQVHHDRREASLHETWLASINGLPLPTFKEADSYKQYTADERLQFKDRAHRLLNEFGRDPRQPFWSAAAHGEKQGKRTSLIVRACNLLPDLMSVAIPNPDGRTITWQPITTLTREPVFQREVWSMNVEPHHNYIADGICTQNNLYQWRGSDPEVFNSGEAASTRTLSRSWRVPAQVHAYAVDWIQQIPGRVPTEYLPRLDPAVAAAAIAGDVDPSDPTLPTAPGSVSRVPYRWSQPEALIPKLIDDSEQGTVMVLATCSYMLAPLIGGLRQRGVPFHNPYRAENGGWNPLAGAGRLLALLRPDPGTYGPDARLWTWDDVNRWVEPLAAKGVTKRGAKALIESKATPDRFNTDPVPVEIGTLAQMFEPEALEAIMSVDGDPTAAVEWWWKNVRASRMKSMNYSVNVYRRFGGKALRREPRVIVGTIHSVKGGESNAVYVFPDLSRAGYWGGWDRPGTGRDAIRRQFYVAFTRTRDHLKLCRESGAEFVQFPTPQEAQDG